MAQSLVIAAKEFRMPTLVLCIDNKIKLSSLVTLYLLLVKIFSNWWRVYNIRYCVYGRFVKKNLL